MRVVQFRLKTSKRTEQIFNSIYQKEYLQPFALSKIAIALAIRDGFKAETIEFLDDSDGLDLNRQTITGERDLLFKSLIEMNEGTYLDDEVYFPEYVKKYIDYGAILLEQEMKYSKDVYRHLVNLDKGI